MEALAGDADCNVVHGRRELLAVLALQEPGRARNDARGEFPRIPFTLWSLWRDLVLSRKLEPTIFRDWRATASVTPRRAQALWRNNPPGPRTPFLVVSYGSWGWRRGHKQLTLELCAHPASPPEATNASCNTSTADAPRWRRTAQLAPIYSGDQSTPAQEGLPPRS